IELSLKGPDLPGVSSSSSITLSSPPLKRLHGEFTARNTSHRYDIWQTFTIRTKRRHNGFFCSARILTCTLRAIMNRVLRPVLVVLMFASGSAPLFPSKSYPTATKDDMIAKSEAGGTIVTPEQFGAVGDCTSDDTQPLIRMRDTVRALQDKNA